MPINNPSSSTVSLSGDFSSFGSTLESIGLKLDTLLSYSLVSLELFTSAGSGVLYINGQSIEVKI